MNKLYKYMLLFAVTVCSTHLYADIDQTEAKKYFDYAIETERLNYLGNINPGQLPKDFHAEVIWNTLGKIDTTINVNGKLLNKVLDLDLASFLTKFSNKLAYENMTILDKNKSDKFIFLARDIKAGKTTSYYLNTSLGRSKNLLFDNLILDLASSSVSNKVLAKVEKELNKKWIKFTPDEFNKPLNELLKIKSDKLNYSFRDAVSSYDINNVIELFLYMDKYIGEDIYAYEDINKKIHEIPSYIYIAKIDVDNYAKHLYNDGKTFNEYKLIFNIKDFNEFNELIKNLYSELELQVYVSKDKKSILRVVQPDYVISSADGKLKIISNSDSHRVYPINYNHGSLPPAKDSYLTIKKLSRMINSK